MATQFTAGPWEVSLEAVRFVIQHTPDHGMGKRALAYTAGSEPANPFNAYLIAAAPDLHYVATLVTELADILGDNNAVVQLALKALRKARGES